MIGDFQVPPEQWEGHHLLNVLKAEVVCTAKATVTTGGELDYVLASCKVAPFLELEVTWDVPWKPHAGLIVKVNKAAPRLILQQLTQYAAVPRLEDAPRSWDDFEPTPKLFWMGKQGGPKEQQCAAWCHQAEQYVLQNLQDPKQGRGWYLALELKPLPAVKPLTPCKKGDLAYWGQFCSILAHVAHKGAIGAATHMHLRAKAADLDQRWQEVHGKEAFVAALQDLLNGDCRPLTLLTIGAEANKDYAKKQALELQSKEYQVWLAQAALRGHSGIYRTLKAPDAIHVRPYRNVPVQDRQKLREQQWYGQWEVVDKPQASAERERLRWEAIQQARRWEDLDPHWVMRKFQRLPQKACGPDGISYALLKNLPLEGVTALCSLYRNWELTGRLPDQVCTTLVLLLPKKEDIERPISLTSVLYRTWCKLRWDKLKDWQSSIGTRLPWERSMPGTQVLHVALMRLLKCEVSRAVDRHVVSLLIDLQCFYDSVALEQSGPRLLQAEQVTSTAVFCKKGILAGCPIAPLVAKLVLAPVIEGFLRGHPKASVDVWIDDISVDFVGQDAITVCREALAGYEELKQGLESAGLKLSTSKTGFLSSTNECKRFINLHRTEDQPRAHDLLKDLGLDSSGARRRRIGTQQKRLTKGRRRHMKLTHLKLRSRPVRVRVWKTSVRAAVSYGIEAQGMAPQRVKVLQQQLARHGGYRREAALTSCFINMPSFKTRRTQPLKGS